ncbi:hypothetical protein BU204_20650 [Actinophytocola xanthii]|uniref:Uncharacterized protein n=1 Tax=Actinophytocola xanthii TaxID=1912961 RepID=A0A1Q8CMR1_9PSEU|nr:hypothetical protein BU204_20650 [Actinophytocola xanthii]
MALERAITEAGGDSLRFNAPAVGLRNATAHQVQAAYRDVPINAFAVTGAWYHTQDQYGEWWTAMGNWNFRDDYVNGSNPDDASGLATDDVDKNCWQNDGDTLSAYDYQNNYYDQTYRHTATVNESVWQIRDRTQGFVLKSDHGTHLLHFRRIGYGCDNKMVAGYHFEHNQDGDASSWGVSISVGVMSLSYSGDAGDTLKKSTPVFYNNPPS